MVVLALRPTAFPKLPHGLDRPQGHETSKQMLEVVNAFSDGSEEN